MLACYLDEAGGKREQSTVVCGWISTVAKWEQFEIDWKLFLLAYKVTDLHMKYFSQSKGQFSKWKGADAIRRSFISDAHSIIKDHVNFFVACFADHRLIAIADKNLRVSEMFGSPYAIAGRACVAQVEAWRNRQSDPSQIKYIFEDGCQDKKSLVEALSLPDRLPSVGFEPSRDIASPHGILRKGVVQLQAADFLAYELRKHKQEFACRSGRKRRESLYGLLRTEAIAMASFSHLNAVKLLGLASPIEKRQ